MSGARRWRPALKLLLLALLLLIVAGAALPETLRIPVAGANRNDWHPDSFWYEPWGRSGVHKGIDIFAAQGTPVLAPSYGLVVFRGELSRGGKVVLLLGPKWRLHYLAHLASIAPKASGFVAAGTELGSVGTTGNARGKPPHLHYSVLGLLPRPWAWDGATQGWKKMFFRDPGALLSGR